MNKRLLDLARKVFRDPESTQKQLDEHLDRLGQESTDSALEIPELSTVHPAPHGGGKAPSADEMADLLMRGGRALKGVAEGAPIAAGDESGLEAIVLLYGRPALIVQDDDFAAPPIEWDVLNNHREQICRNLRSVGRIELQNHHTYDWVGTGFLAGADVLMTNRHVADIFMNRRRDQWTFQPGVTARVDYKEEYRRQDAVEFELSEFLGAHPEYDLALFKVAPMGTGGQEPREPLTIAVEAPAAPVDVNVYAVGYPARDGRRNDPVEMLRIFENVFDVKRLQPGMNTGVSPDLNPIMSHDCSTLGGNSGSAVFELETSKVIALHFAGRYLEGNKSIPLWKLVDDPFLKRFSIHWG